MRDLKGPKAGKVKSNRRKVERAPRDWKKVFRVTLRLGVWTASAGLAISASLLVLRFFMASNYFQVETVRVEANRRLSAEDVVALSEIRLGASIFDLDLEAIGHKIEEDPWIATARVERIFPREVVIRIAERTPIAVISLGYLYYVDVTGEIFKVLEGQDRLDFPVVTGIDRGFLLEKPAEARQLLVAGMALLEEVGTRSRFGLGEVSELHIDPAEGYILTTLTGGVPVRLGFGNFPGKLDRLEHIYPELKAQLSNLRYIDLNVADRVIVRLDPKLLRVEQKLLAKHG